MLPRLIYVHQKHFDSKDHLKIKTRSNVLIRCRLIINELPFWRFQLNAEFYRRLFLTGARNLMLKFVARVGSRKRLLKWSFPSLKRRNFSFRIYKANMHFVPDCICLQTYFLSVDHTFFQTLKRIYTNTLNRSFYSFNLNINVLWLSYNYLISFF